MSQFDISVVIGFRDWGARRLHLAVESISNSFGLLSGEIILVDYGSKDPSSAIEIAERFQAKLVRVTDAPVWSRSRALNAGFAIATGDLYISTDADMLFAPKTLETVHQWWRSSSDSALFLQCRDLPETVTAEYLTSYQRDWQYLESVSALRPRWGVGGMMAISQDAFRQLRGFDERMTTYGREDMDFALRARRMGRRMVWVEEKSARIYHMWHPPTAVALKDDFSANRSINLNRKIYAEDATVIRNRTRWIYNEESPLPIISVLLCDGLEVNRDLVKMLRLQTVSSFEIIVPAHLAGDSHSLNDSRIRPCAVPDASLSSLIASSRGRYVLPLSGVSVIAVNYLEKMLDQMSGMTRLVVSDGMDGSNVGAAVAPSVTSNLLRGFLFDRTLFAEIVIRFEQEKKPTRESFVSITEENGLEYVTANDANYLELTNSASSQDDTLLNGSVFDSEQFWPFLTDPDSEVVVQVNGENIHTLAGVSLDGELSISSVSIDGRSIRSESILRNATVDDLLVLSSHGCDFTRIASAINIDVGAASDMRWGIDALHIILDQLSWEPHAAIFVNWSDPDHKSHHAISMSYSRVIQRVQGASREELKVYLTRDKQESDLVFSNSLDSISFIVLGYRQEVAK